MKGIACRIRAFHRREFPTLPTFARWIQVTCLASLVALILPVRSPAQSVDPALLATLLDRWQPERGEFAFGLIGDQQYNAEQEAKFPNLMRALNRERLKFVVHDGDIKAGNTRCTDELFLDRLEAFQASRHPFLYTPGDNEWTDCHTPAAGGYDPEERLAMLRGLFFSDPNESLGRRRLEVSSQFEDSRYSLYVENQLWTMGPVVFATVHIVGSNNNRGRTPQADREYAARNEANLSWIRTAFALAREGGFDAMMLITQANLRFEMLPAMRTGFNDTIAVLHDETIAFGKPVVLVHGDTHYFRMDKPLLGTLSQRRLENFTRLETFGTNDVHWVLGRVERGNPNVFVFEQRIVEENLVAH